MRRLAEQLSQTAARAARHRVERGWRQEHTRRLPSRVAYLEQQNNLFANGQAGCPIRLPCVGSTRTLSGPSPGSRAAESDPREAVRSCAGVGSRFIEWPASNGVEGVTRLVSHDVAKPGLVRPDEARVDGDVGARRAE